MHVQLLYFSYQFFHTLFYWPDKCIYHQEGKKIKSKKEMCTEDGYKTFKGK